MLSPSSKPSITIVIPTYERQYFLEQTISSVLEQTCAVDQILVIDDGSEESTLTALHRLAERSSRIEIHHLPQRQGVSVARNVGIEYATGDFILFLDDDDLLHPRMIETSLEHLMSDPLLDVSTCLYEMFFAKNGEYLPVPAALLFNYRMLERDPLCFVDKTNFVPGDWLERKPLSAFLRFLVPIHSCLIRRESIGTVRFPEDLQQGEDTYFWVMLAQQGCRFSLHEQCHAYIRRHSRNTTRSRSMYYKQIIPLYERLLQEGAVAESADRFLVHLKLAHFNFEQGRSDWTRHAVHVIFHPIHLWREAISVLLVKIQERRNLLRFYFAD